MSFRIDQLAVYNLATVGGSITAGSFVKSGGTSSQFLKADGSVDTNTYITGITSGMITTALGYTPVPTTRTLTINGTAYDLSADRSWTISAGVSSVSGSGAGISVSPTTGAVVVSNTGVTSNVAGTGISVSSATGAVTITNTGVTSIVAGTAITVSGSTGAVTINNAGVTSLNGSTGALTGFATQTWVTSQGYITGNQTITLSGDVTGSGTTSIATTLANSGVSAGTYGGNNSIPSLVIDAKGRVTSASTVTPSGTWGISISGNSATTSQTNFTSLTVNSNTVLHAGNYNSYSPTLTGTGASGTWSISITGNADTVDGYHASAFALASTYPGGYIPINPDGDGTAWAYSDQNPTINGIYVGGGQYFGADGAINSGFLQARIVNAYNGGFVNSALGYYVGDFDFGANSNTYSTTQVINSSAYWVGSRVIPSYNSGVTGSSAPTYNQTNIEVYTTSNNVPAIGFHRSAYSATTLYEYDGQLYVNAWVSRPQNGLLLSSGNYNSYAPTLTGGGASGTWSINITGSAGSASSASSVPWTGVTAGVRTNYTLRFQPPSSDYAGFEFNTSSGGGAGYFLVRGTSDNDVYTAEGITLVADAGWLTLAQRTTSNKGVRIMTGASSTTRIEVVASGMTTVNSGLTVLSGLAWNNATPALNVGGSGDGRIQVRHIWGKSASSSGTDHLWLQYSNTGNHVQIGDSGGGNNLYVSGNIYMNGYFAGNLVATQSWVSSQGYVTGGPFLPLAGGTMSGDIVFPNDSAVALKNASGTAGFRPDDQWGNIYTWNYSGGYYVDATAYYLRSASATLWMTITGSGTVEAMADMRAPIFYDSANTAYYCDPASTSVLNTISSYTIYNTSLGSGYYFTAGSWGWRHQTPSGYIEFGPANTGHAHIYTDRSNFYFNVDVMYQNGYRLYGDNYRPYADSAGNADTVDGYHATAFPYRSGGSSGYYQVADWMQFNTSAGLYWPSYNGAHIYPNTSTSYGSIRIDGTRNGWRGIVFDGSVNLMMNDNETGHYKVGYGWQWRWYQGTLYCSRSTYGGGTEYTVWDSGNLTNLNQLSNGPGYITSSSNVVGLYSSGFGSSNFTWYQSPTPLSPYTGSWASYLVSNHGDGATYYNQTIVMPFWGIPEYFRKEGGTNKGPYQFFTSEHGSTFTYATNMNQYVRTSDNPTFGDIYSNGWFRNNNNNQGLYNQNTTQHWSSKDNGYWDASSTTTISSIRFWTGGHVSSLRGYVYANTSNEIGFLNSGGSWSLRMDNSGNATATGDVTAYSDARVKENVITVENALDKILNLRGVYYNRIDTEDKRRKVGVIAQEIMEVLPEVVGKDTDGMYNVAYGNIVGVLIEAIKEQQKMIDELKARLN